MEPSEGMSEDGDESSRGGEYDDEGVSVSENSSLLGGGNLYANDSRDVERV